MRNVLKGIWGLFVLLLCAMLVGAVAGALTIGYRLVTSMVPGAR